MNIIDQLEQTVTPAVLGTSGSVAHVSLLEQFYAILVTRLAIPEVYTQLQRTDNFVSPAASNILFEQLWQQPNQQHLLIQELAATHHIDETTTGQLVINATHLAYQELKNLADGQFLPAFLQAQQSAIRHYLPVWATAVIAPAVAVLTKEPALATEALIYENSQIPNEVIASDQAIADNGVPVIVDVNDGAVPSATDAIHANPSAYYTPETRAAIRSRNQRHDLLVRLLLLGGALLAIGLIWALFFKNNEVEPVQTVAVAPVVTTPEVVAPPQVLMPAQLMVNVDDSGNLYTCTAIVGDVNLQASLRQALMVSFGEQASICEVTVEAGIATTLTNINIETLPNVLTLLRATPFSRLKLQNDSISLEAPDDVLLQRLLVDVRTLVPTMPIVTAIPTAIAQPPANTYDETYNNNNDSYNNNEAMPYNGSAPITTNDNMMTNQPNQPTANNNNNNNNNNNFETPPPPPPSSNNMSQNNQSAQSSGPISQAEVDAIANTTIVSEPAQGGRPINQ